MPSDVKEDEIEVKVEEPTKDDDKKDDKQEGPKPGSERWNEIYWKAKEGERAIERAKELEKTLSDAASHNKQLAEAIEKLAGNLEKPDDRPGQIESKITELRAAKKVAREKADFDTEDRIDEELADLRFELRSIKNGKKEEKIEKRVDSIKTDYNSDLEVYKAWVDENEWFSKSPKMRGFAIKSEGEIRKDPDLEYATVEEVLAEVKKRVVSKYGDSKGIDMVEGDGEPPKRELSGTVKINKTEQEIAKGLGISQEELAKQKLVMQKVNATLGSRRK